MTTRFDDEDPSDDPLFVLLRGDEATSHLAAPEGQFATVRRRARRRRAVRTGAGAALATAAACAALFTLTPHGTERPEQRQLPLGPGPAASG
ncbi:hypothetical protein G3I42_28225, partial [Streptomyces sp. SID11385]|nr:hypothetical protein [Streptomyces sp. SID11385]